ncbi:hypothetical protein BASA81_006463 [Batrachochytrium salamandrivorans]|nr:hypothetical protein BASA81_006463 [Batrachochytrium salamandrivorans]
MLPTSETWRTKMANPRMSQLIAHTKIRLQVRFPRCRFLVVFGSTNYDFSHMPVAEYLLAQELGRQLSSLKDVERLVLLTGGNPVTGIAIGNHSPKLRVVHLCPTEFTMPPTARGEVWTDVGLTMAERQMILASAADIAVSFGGGPGTRNELEIAGMLEHCKVVPLMFTGGASLGASLANLNLANPRQLAAWDRIIKVDGTALERAAATPTAWQAIVERLASDILLILMS